MRCAIFALFLLVKSAIGLEHGLMQKEKGSTELQPLERAGTNSKPKPKPKKTNPFEAKPDKSHQAASSKYCNTQTKGEELPDHTLYNTTDWAT